MEMKTPGFSAAGSVLCLLALFSTAAADDELEVTMEIIEDLDDLEGIREMRGPTPDNAIDDARDADGDVPEAAYDPGMEEGDRDGFGDDFEHDDVNDDMNDGLDREGDFEESEQVDDDAFDEEQHDTP
jgi:hypothetical protein